jgi:hypothetical protein
MRAVIPGTKKEGGKMIKDDKDDPCTQACNQIFCDDCPFGEICEELTQEEADKRTKMVIKK